MKKVNRDIKIKKIQAKNEQVCSIWDQIEFLEIKKTEQTMFRKFFPNIKKNLAYISFAFMFSSITLYVFFIISVIIFAVEEKTLTTTLNKIDTENMALINIDKDVDYKIKDKDGIVYIQRVAEKNALSIR